MYKGTPHDQASPWMEKKSQEKSHGKKVTGNKVTGKKVTIYIKDQEKTHIYQYINVVGHDFYVKSWQW